MSTVEGRRCRKSSIALHSRRRRIDETRRAVVTRSAKTTDRQENTDQRRQEDFRGS